MTTTTIRHCLTLFVHQIESLVMFMFPGQIGGWRRSSVFRTSVFGWQTFPDLCLIYG